MNTYIGFIGAGNMGGALASAVSLTVSSKQVMICDKDDAKARQLSEKLGCLCATGEEIIQKCGVVFLGVKPQFLASAIEELALTLQKLEKKPLFVSMAAGVAISRLEALLGEGAPIIRIMPNTPVSVGEGMILWCANKNVSDEQKKLFLSINEKSGKLDLIDEALIDAASALSGCGPAFVYMFIEALADGGVKCGLPRDKALFYAEQTLLGASKLALESKAHPGALKDAVCSPAGSTIEGVRKLENGALRSSVIEAVNASFERTKALGK